MNLRDLIQRANWDASRKRLLTHPDEAKVADEDGMFPLHWACQRKAPLDVLRELLRIHPDAANAKTSDGYFPLHCLLNGFGGHGAPSLEEIDLIIKSNPGALRTKNNDGQLPLHDAVMNKDISDDVIKSLIKEYPEGVLCKNGRGELPLHCASYNNGIRSEVLGALIKAHPGGIFSKNNDGKTPFDFAKKYGNEAKYREACVNNLDWEAAASLTLKDTAKELEEARAKIAKLEQELGRATTKAENVQSAILLALDEFKTIHID